MSADALKRCLLAAPLVERVCAFSECELLSPGDPSLIVVISRDVRVHPRYESALQGTASLVNTAGYA